MGRASSRACAVVIAEGIGLGIPIVALPFANTALAAHPAFGRDVETLRSAGVQVLLGPGGYEPQPPYRGSQNLYVSVAGRVQCG